MSDLVIRIVNSHDSNKWMWGERKEKEEERKKRRKGGREERREGRKEKHSTHPLTSSSNTGKNIEKCVKKHCGICQTHMPFYNTNC